MSDAKKRNSRVPKISFVLVEPRSPGNVGASARALKNSGLKSMRLVRPPPLDGEATKMAWKSLDVLRSARHYETLHAAIRDAHLVIAFTARTRRDFREVISLEDAVPRILEAEKQGRVCLVFGREDRGLTREELEPASLLVRIGASKTRQVYNLSQAVLLTAHALFVARGDDVSPVEKPPARGAALRMSDRQHLLDRLREILVSLDYENHQDRGLLRRIMGRMTFLLDRAELDQSDQAMILGIIKRLKGRRDSR